MKKYLARLTVVSIAFLALVAGPVGASSAVPQNQSSYEGLANQIASGQSHACVIDANEHAVCWGDNTYGQTTVPADLGEVRQVTVGGYFSCALKVTGVVKCWGGYTRWKQNYLQDINEIRVPEINEEVTAISSDFWNSCAIGLSGALYCWGGNQYGESPNGVTGIKQVDVGFLTTCAITTTDTVQCWGNNDSGQTIVPSNLGQVKQVATGVRTCVVTTSGEVKCWGRNFYGELAIPSDLGFVTQVSVGERNVCALNTQGIVKCWGDTGTRINILPGDISSVKEISTAVWISCAISVIGKVWCWGDGFEQSQSALLVPALAVKNLPAVSSAIPTFQGQPVVGSALEVKPGDWGSGAYLTYQWLRDGLSIEGETNSNYSLTKADYLHEISVQVTGSQTGYTSVSRSSETVLVLAEKSADVVALPQVSAGYDHTCAVNKFGVAYCWGGSSYGKSVVPADLGKVTQISAGHDHSCAIRISGQVFCWGNDLGGASTPPLDLGLVTQVSAGGNYTCAIKINKQLRCWGWNGQGNTSVPTDLGQVSQVSAGYSHVCAVTTAGAVRCWGEDSYSHEVNIPWYLPSNYPMSEVSAGWHHTCAKSASGSIFCWGSNSDNQANIGIPSDIGQVAQLSAGYNHTCALTQSGGYRCWGNNSYSQTDPKASLPSLSQVSSGMFHTCAVTTLGKVLCWGTNVWGGTGNGSTDVPASFYLGAQTLTPLPELSGSGTIGTTLLASPGAWDEGVNLSYRWLRDGEPIIGESKRSYVIRRDDLSHQISIQVTGSKYGYKTEVSISAAVAVDLRSFSKQVRPIVTGRAQVGQTLRTRITDLGSGVTYTYQWQRDGNPIQNATGRFYELGLADLGSIITFKVCGSKVDFQTLCLVSNASQSVGLGQISKRPVPRIWFTSTKVGAVLEGKPGNWRQDIDLEYFWLRDGLPIQNSNSQTYRITEVDRGHSISFKVVARLSGYNDVVCLTPGRKIP